jgi:hypothetical protein
MDINECEKDVNQIFAKTETILVRAQFDQNAKELKELGNRVYQSKRTTHTGCQEPTNECPVCTKYKKLTDKMQSAADKLATFAEEDDAWTKRLHSR